MVSNMIRLKLFINKKSNKLLYAEAGKDFVDLLLSILTLPGGSVVKHLKQDSMVGCIGNLYESIENLSDNYIQIGKNKSMLLNPTPPFVPFGPNSPRLLQNDEKGNSMKFYACNDHMHRCFTDFRGAPCQKCKRAMEAKCVYVAKDGASSSSVGGGGPGGFVISYTYIVTDDLEVKPIETKVLNDIHEKYGVNAFGEVENREVEVAEAEGLAFLKASLQSKTVLTDIFLGSEA